MPGASPTSSRKPFWRLTLPGALAWLLVIFFLWLTGRFWHPYYGFTKFIQIESQDAQVMLPELRDTTIYVYHHAGGYDGSAYAQLAARPAANDDDLRRAIDSLPYRARRILLSWVAYALAWGDAVHAAQIYAGLNLVVWLALAWLLAKLFPLHHWRGVAGWAGVLFCAGALHSVRLALTDLAAMALIAASFLAAETKRPNRATLCLAAAGLVRETSVLSAGALWPGLARENRWTNWLRLALTLVPLGLWFVYLKLNTGPVGQGMGNFTWPVIGAIEKIISACHDLTHIPETWLALTTLLATVALLTQLAYFFRRREFANPWWRLGAVYAVLMLCLGEAVWAGHPGAATRIMLPLTLAFNVLVFRRRESLAWLLLGNLSVLSGVQALWHVPQDQHELDAGRVAGGAFVAHLDEQWYQTERGRGRTWAWTSTDGTLHLRAWPHPEPAQKASFEIALRAISPRPLEIKQGERILWQGEIGVPRTWITLPEISFHAGEATLSFHSPSPPQRENDSSTARALGFAISGVREK